MSLDSFARVPLLFGPSPVHRLERLGLAYGGNKMRKLEHLVAEALAQGCDTLVSIGGVGRRRWQTRNASSAFSSTRSLRVQ
jgi:1-aminocyclopropane-1-carboxylate deaminase